MSVYLTSGSIRKLPIPIQAEVTACDRDAFVFPNATHSSIGGVVRNAIGLPFQSEVAKHSEVLMKSEQASLEKKGRPWR
jgi:hypothetical protein